MIDFVFEKRNLKPQLDNRGNIEAYIADVIVIEKENKSEPPIIEGEFRIIEE